MAVWVLVLLALIGALYAAELSERDARGHFLMLACTTAAAFGIVTAFRRDAFAACKVTAMVAFITAGFAGVAIFLLDERGEGVQATLLGCSCFGLACVAYRARAYRAVDRLPNLLLDEFGRGAIRELDGIQFVAWASSEEVTAGDSFDIHLMAQSCWDTERTLQVKIVQEFVGKSSAVSFEKRASLVLGGGEVALLRIPVRTNPGARGSVRLALKPRVTGQAGTRIRRFRARSFEKRISGSFLQFAFFFMGFAAGGGGIAFTMRIHKGDPTDPAQYDPLPPEIETLYRPDPTELRALAMDLVR